MDNNCLLLINKEDDGSIRIQLGDEKPHSEGIDAAGYALICAIFESSEGVLEATDRLLGVFKNLEGVLLDYYADPGNLSDEDIDKIAEVVLNDPS